MSASSSKTPGEIVAELIMTRQVFSGAFVLVEGDDDSKFWRPRTSSKHCDFLITGGKATLLAAIVKLEQGALRGFLGIADDDCDKLCAARHPSLNIVWSHTRDLEGVQIQSNAFDKLLAEYGDSAKIKSFENREGESVREALLKRALPLGRLRYYAIKNAIPLDFKKLPAIRFIDIKTWAFDESGLHQAALQQGLIPSLAALHAGLAALPVASSCWDVCQGHDMVDIIGPGFASVLGNKNPGRDRVASLLRGGVEAAEFMATSVVADILAWESINPPYRVI